MKKKTFTKMFSVTLAAALVFAMTACGSSSSGSDTSTATNDSTQTEAGDSGDGAASDESSANSDASSVSLASITLGEDYTDISADLKFLTHRTDRVDTTFQEYIAEFQEMYPNINIEYEAVTDYANDILTRLTTGDWGDICMIPTSIDKDELGTYFAPLGTVDELSSIYDSQFLDSYAYEGTSYGVPSVANVQGVLYNKAVFEEAGITEVPKTPEEFLDALQLIKDNTDAIPLYTNFGAGGWTMAAWDAYIDAGATGDPNFAYEGITKGQNPFSDRGDWTGPYAVYYCLYEAVARGLTEDDPTTTDWEGSKGMINRGEIGVMVLGSWAITQMQDAGDYPDDIGYMAFPITVDGQQYMAAGGDYNYGINVNSSDDNKIAAMCYIKYLLEESGFAGAEGGLSVVIGDELPAVFDSLTDVQMVVNAATPDEDANLFNDINNESELGINVSGELGTQCVEAAIQGSPTYQELVDSWNESWTAAQAEYGVTFD